MDESIDIETARRRIEGLRRRSRPLPEGSFLKQVMHNHIQQLRLVPSQHVGMDSLPEEMIFNIWDLSNDPISLIRSLAPTSKRYLTMADNYVRLRRDVLLAKYEDMAEQDNERFVAHVLPWLLPIMGKYWTRRTLRNMLRESLDNGTTYTELCRAWLRQRQEPYSMEKDGFITMDNAILTGDEDIIRVVGLHRPDYTRDDAMEVIVRAITDDTSFLDDAVVLTLRDMYNLDERSIAARVLSLFFDDGDTDDTSTRVYRLVAACQPMP